MTLLQPIVWWILVQTLAVAALPLAGGVGRGLPGQGYALAKPLGVLVSAWLFWLGVSAGGLPNDGRGAVVAVLLMAVVAWGLRWRDVLPAPSLPDRRLLAAVEVAWTAAFVLALVLRAGDAAILGGEKPSEFAMLNATMSAPSYPPADPWLAGYALNYYYLGYVVVGHVAHLAGTTPGVAFTLGIPMVMGLAVSAALGIGYDLAAQTPARSREHGEASGVADGAGVRDRPPRRAVAVGGAGAAMLLVGNLEVVVEGVRAVSGSAGRALGRWLGMSAYEPAFHQDFWFPDAWWQRAALVLKDEGLAGDLRPLSTEFPFYDVMLGDLHAPILTLPFAILAVWLALVVFRDRRRGSSGSRTLLSFLFLALAIGALWAANAWFLPSLLLLGAVAIGLPDRGPATGAEGRGAPGARSGGRVARGGWTLARVLAAGAAVAVAAWVLYLPFHLHYDAPVQGLEWVLFEGTTLRQLLVAVGPLLAGTAVVLALASSDARRGGARIGRPVMWLTGVLIVVPLTWLATVLAVRLAGAAEEQGLDFASLLLANLGELIARRALGGPALVVLAAGVAWVVVIGWRAAAGREAEERPEGAGAGSTDSTGRAFAVTLAGVGLLTLLVPEVVYFDDGQGWRYNMVLKLHFVAWVLLAPVAGWGVVAAFRARASGGAGVRTLSWAALLAVTVAAMYPVTASVHRVGEADWALDGAAGARTRYAADARAMAWLCATAPAGTVITEAVGQAFSDGGRISAATGLPTVLGWPGHQRTYRGPGIWPEVERRRADVARIYQTGDRTELGRLLERYGVSLVYLGPLERAAYPGAGEGAAASLPVEYDDGMVRILRGPAPTAGPPLACRPGP